MDQLKMQGVSFQKIGDTTLSLPSGTQIDPPLVKDKHYVVQDLNSQRIRELFPSFESIKHPSIWDCCAASGGKSLLAWDCYDRPELTVSDIRKSILQNLQVRLQQAEVPVQRMFSADLTLTAQRNGNTSAHSGTNYDLVIADVPCTGSGTWARTPEQLVYFKREQLAVYVEKQQSILRNTVPLIREGGYLLYVTCSVFRAENEAQVDWLQKEQGLQLIRSASFVGYSSKADTLFAALLTA
jgi:16S rRNA (cytosine967-C5)-methyltransferase